MAKQENKFIRFGFFKCCFICNTDDVSKKIKKFAKSNKPEDKKRAEALTKLLNELKTPSSLFVKILEAIKSGKISYLHNIKGKLIEVDRETFITNNNKLFLQVLYDRDDAISKKKPGESRESIDLDEDEYISEFTSIMYNSDSNILMSQYNKYAVSIGQLSCFFSECLDEFFQYNFKPIEKMTTFPAKIDFTPIIEPSRLKSIKKNKCIEKMTIKGSLSGIENIKKETDLNLPILNISKEISSVNAYEFNLTITANKTREGKKIEYDSIDQNFCSSLYDAYEKVGDKDNIDVEMQYQNENSIREVLKWSLPIKIIHLPFLTDKRKEIPFKEICDKMTFHL